LSEYQDLEFPPDIPDGYDEPLGLHFARANHEEMIQCELDAVLMGMEADNVDPPSMSNSPENGNYESVEEAQDAETIDEVVEHVAEESASVAAAAATNPPFVPQDLGMPQSVWARKLGGMSHASALTKFLDIAKELSEAQSEAFWSIVSEVCIMLGDNASEASKVDAIYRAWQRRHCDLAAVNGVGLVGWMTKAHIKAILKKSGRKMLATELGVGSIPPVSMAPSTMQPNSFQMPMPLQDLSLLPLAAPVRYPLVPSQLMSVASLVRPTGPTLSGQPPNKKPKRTHMPTVLKFEDIDGLTTDQLGVALRKANLGLSRDKSVRRTTLKKHFQDQNDDSYQMTFT
jgi:hypothetical protein